MSEKLFAALYTVCEYTISRRAQKDVLIILDTISRRAHEDVLIILDVEFGSYVLASAGEIQAPQGSPRSYSHKTDAPRGQQAYCT